MAATSQTRSAAAPAAGVDAELRRLSIDTIRGLAMDAVQKANAGHPGTAMALAPLAYTIFERFLRANPNDPDWPDRDRFVLSAGHACMLQYALLHLRGYDLGIADLEQFRQWGSRTPGTPSAATRRASRSRPGRSARASPTPSAWRSPSASSRDRFNRPGSEVVDHHVYVICSDGDMMEGVSQEAVVDRGQLRARQADRLLRRQPDHDRRHDRALVRRREPRRALRSRRLARPARRGLRGRRGARGGARRRRARKASARRSSQIRSHIAYPAPKAVDTAKSHGSALGEDEVRATKEAMGFDPDKHFWVDERVYEHMSLRDARRRGAGASGPERFAVLARGEPRAGRGLGSAPGPGGCATAGASRCRASRPARRSRRARPGRR